MVNFGHLGFIALASITNIIPYVNAELTPRDVDIIPRHGHQDNHPHGLPNQNDDCPVVIDIDPEICGCKPGEIAVFGSCQPIKFGDDLATCSGKCKPGQWCRQGSCEAIQIILDPVHCGSFSPEECGPASACINGVCQTLKFDDDAHSCGLDNKTVSCRPGHHCWKGQCRPITVGSSKYGIVGTDPCHCGPDNIACEPGSICMDGRCEWLGIGDDSDNCGDKSRPGTFCYGKEIIPIHIATDKTCCKEGEFSVSGVCVRGSHEEEHHGEKNGHHDQHGHPEQYGKHGHGHGHGHGQKHGHGHGHGHQHGHNDRLPYHHNGARPEHHKGPHEGSHKAGGFGKSVIIVENQGHSWEFGKADDCSGHSCSFNSICCFGSCLSIDKPWGPGHGDWPFGGCKNCPDGHFCWENSCRPIFIGDGDDIFGGRCGSSRCSANEVCLSGVVCLDLTPGDPSNCGGRGPCPGDNDSCLLGTCIPGIPTLPPGTGLPSGSPGPQPTGTPGPLLCGGSTCASEEVCFEDVCRNLATDPTNCGYPGIVCPSTLSLCVSGLCTNDPAATCGGVTCPLPEICVENECRNPVNNPNACGPDGVSCATTETCENGVCRAQGGSGSPESGAEQPPPGQTGGPGDSEAGPGLTNPSEAPGPADPTDAPGQSDPTSAGPGLPGPTDDSTPPPSSSPPASACGAGCDAGFACVGSGCRRILSQSACALDLIILERQAGGCEGGQICLAPAADPTATDGECVPFSSVGLSGEPDTCGGTGCTTADTLCAVGECWPIRDEAECGPGSPEITETLQRRQDFQCPADQVCLGFAGGNECTPVVPADDAGSTGCDADCVDDVEICYAGQCRPLASSPQDCAIRTAIPVALRARQTDLGCPSGFACAVIDPQSPASCVSINGAVASADPATDQMLCDANYSPPQDEILLSRRQTPGPCPADFTCIPIPTNDDSQGVPGSGYACVESAALTSPGENENPEEPTVFTTSNIEGGDDAEAGGEGSAAAVADELIAAADGDAGAGGDASGLDGSDGGEADTLAGTADPGTDATGGAVGAGTDADAGSGGTGGGGAGTDDDAGTGGGGTVDGADAGTDGTAGAGSGGAGSNTDAGADAATGGGGTVAGTDAGSDTEADADAGTGGGGTVAGTDADADSDADAGTGGGGTVAGTDAGADGAGTGADTGVGGDGSDEEAAAFDVATDGAGGAGAGADADAGTGGAGADADDDAEGAGEGVASTTEADADAGTDAGADAGADDGADDGAATAEDDAAGDGAAELEDDTPAIDADGNGEEGDSCESDADCAEGFGCSSERVCLRITLTASSQAGIEQAGAGAAGATCTSNSDCATGLSCLSGECFRITITANGQGVVAADDLSSEEAAAIDAAGATGISGSCTSSSNCAAGLSCLSGECVRITITVTTTSSSSSSSSSVAGPGEACSATRPCDTSLNLQCFQGECVRVTIRPNDGNTGGGTGAGPGEACSASTPCNANLGLSCYEGECVRITITSNTNASSGKKKV